MELQQNGRYQGTEKLPVCENNLKTEGVNPSHGFALFYFQKAAILGPKV